ncbi:MAG TPA: hypothetical protein VMS09_09425 [Paenibacillus sp.]|uniref:hypothetical protein n=1 Tax=Paenibacillus sp. TaxID=58172 RepID=UPI0028D5B2E4|nr:hypothetical protein [Paenibacillus sp.]HUC92235.1 hypothetical protein [Paenibacillus sp.]
MANQIKPNEHHKLLIKTVYGRLLLDSDKHGAEFSLEGGEGRWTVAVSRVEPAVMREIERLAEELNLFFFIERPGGDPPIRKWWLYGKHKHPRLMKDADAGRMTIEVDARVEYANDRVML